MPSTYTTRLRLEKPGQGEQAGTWGITANTDYDLIDQGVAGVVSVTHDNAADYTLTALSGSSDEARNMALVIGGTLTGNRNVICPSVQKVYLVRNATVGGFAITIKTAAGTGVQIANGFNRWVYCDGTNVLPGGAAFNPTTNTVSGTMETATRWATARNLTVTGDASGSLTAPWDGSTNATLNITIPGLAQAGVQSISLAGTTPRAGQVTITESDTVNTLLGGNVVRTFQGATTRTGNITLTSGDVTWALGYTPVSSFNSRSGAVVLNATDVTTALGSTAVQNAVNAQTAAVATTYTGTVAGSQVQGNISGNAASISGTILGSQVSGNIAGSAASITGVLSVANGGTQATTASAARTNLGAAASGSVVSSGLTMGSSRILGRTTASTGTIEEISVGSGLSLTNGVLSSTAGGGSVTSVAVSGGTTGLTTSGGPITGSGTITFAGTLNVANGGTGATTASAARTSLGAAGLGANTYSGGQTATSFGIPGGISISAAAITFGTGQDSVYYDQGAVQIAAAGTVRFAISGTQANFSVPASGPSFTSTSDRALKTDIAPVAGALGRVLAYAPVHFKWKQDVPWADGKLHEGFIAQDVETVNPDAVSYSADGVAAIDPVAIIADLVGAVQALEARLAVLEAR